MSDNYSFLKYINLLCAIQLSIFLVSCGDGDGTLPPVTVTASETEGFNPLSVTFYVSGPSSLISGATWFLPDETVHTFGTESLTHIFVNPGEVIVHVSVNARDPSSDDYEFEIPLTVLPNVNLVVSSFAIDDEVTPGGLETISAIIQNIGADTFTDAGLDTVIAHINVGYYLSTDDIITIDDIFIGDTAIFIGESFTESDVPFNFQSLAPGENYQYDHQLAVKGNVPAGTYFAGAIVDFVDEFHWYDFPSSTDTIEFPFPSHVVVTESNEEDNFRLLTAHQVAVAASACPEDLYEPDNSIAIATPIAVGQVQVHNFCHDNSDWLQFDAIQGNVYKITTFSLATEADTQLILYDTDGSSILLFHDNVGNTNTVDLEKNFPPDPTSEIVWEAQATGTYFIKVRVTTCDEDKDPFCETLTPSLSPEGIGSPDGVGLDTGYSITLQ